MKDSPISAEGVGGRQCSNMVRAVRQGRSTLAMLVSSGYKPAMHPLGPGMCMQSACFEDTHCICHPMQARASSSSAVGGAAGNVPITFGMLANHAARISSAAGGDTSVHASHEALLLHAVGTPISLSAAMGIGSAGTGGDGFGVMVQRSATGLLDASGQQLAGAAALRADSNSSRVRTRGVGMYYSSRL